MCRLMLVITAGLKVFAEALFFLDQTRLVVTSLFSELSHDDVTSVHLISLKENIK